MAAPVRVVDDKGHEWLVDPALLGDPNEPTDEGMLQLTIDNQAYQRVGGQWYRLLRCDRVSWVTDIKPNVGGRQPRPMPFVLGRVAGFEDEPL